MAKIGGSKSTKTQVSNIQKGPAPANTQPVVAEPKSEAVVPQVAAPKSEVVVPQVVAPEKNADVPQSTQAPQVVPEKPVKKLEPKPWERIDNTDPNKPRLVPQFTFLGERMDYEPGFKAEYDWSSLKISDGLKRVVTARYPKTDTPDSVDVITFKGYTVTIEKYGNSAVCKLEGPFDGQDNILILEYVSLATVLDVLQDLLNPKAEDGSGVCTLPWGTIDQIIKNKRNLKSRIKTLGEDDLPAGRRGRRKEEQNASTPSNEQLTNVSQNDNNTTAQ